MTKVAVYSRVSTEDQDSTRQYEENVENARSEYDDPEIVPYADILTGKSTIEERGGYRDLWEDIAEYDAVFIDEISRLSRIGSVEIQQFIEHCIENDTSLYERQLGLEFRVDSTELERSFSRMIATLMGELARIELEQLKIRIESGIKSAQKAGKWTGRPPLGFYVDEGSQRLRPILDPEDGSDTYFDVKQAIERILDGESAYSVGQTMNASYQALQRVADTRASMYLDSRADDARVQAALEEV